MPPKQASGFLRAFNPQTAFQRAKSNGGGKKHDPVSLAGALGLLSPSKDITKSPSYKPSLFQTLQRGSVSEQLAEIASETAPDFGLSRAHHQNHIEAVMANLHHASEHVSWSTTSKNDAKGSRPGIYAGKSTEKQLKRHIKALRNEAELLDLVRGLYMENKLTLSLFMDFLLSRHLQDLSKLPFDVANVNHAALSKNGWTTINFTELKILLLKKYHDMEQPLEIIKILKNCFIREFFPLINTHSVSPFYERIVWKFYFEYIGLGQECATIETLDSLRSSFLIWEATTKNTAKTLDKIAHQHSLNTPQRLFLKVASCAPVQKKIDTELLVGKSPLLSALKKVSWKFKIYKAVDAEDVASRAFAFSLMHSLEDLLGEHFSGDGDSDNIAGLLSELRQERSQMIAPGVSEPELECTASFAH
ncbi:hypothetical protein JCM33374_g4724 [Metschnikowia sp. JCM 33374]|nr:hypothetical protein JCM33374_g4724 [Metschnikowia sp. JCM 33374]